MLFAPLLFGSILAVAGAPAAVPPSTLATAPSYLYPGFGTGGIALLTSPSVTAQAQADAPVPPCPAGSCAWSGIQNDVVSAGYEATGSSGGAEMAIGVVNPTTGALITSFDSSSGGLLTDTLGQPLSSTVEATGVAVYPACPHAGCPWSAEAGDVVVVGTENAAGSTAEDIVVAAYSPIGVRQWTANVTPSGYVDVTPPAVALETTGATPTGDVLVAASVFLASGGPTQPLLSALMPGGTVDATFGGAPGSGFILPTTASAPAAETFASVAVDGAGDVLTGGEYIDSASGLSSALFARYTQTGTLDNRFGSPPSGSGTCAPSATPTCSGSVVVGSSGSNVFGAGLAIEPVAGTCANEPACYDVLVAGTYVPGTGNSSDDVAAVTQAGTLATGFGGGLVKLPALATNATGTGIAIQSTSGIVTGVMLSGYLAGTNTGHGVGTVSRLTSAGVVVTSFGTSGTYSIPSGTAQDSKAFAVTTVPGSLDFMMAGALLGTTDEVTRFALARVIGEVVTLGVAGARDTHAQNTDYVTVKITAPAPVPGNLSVNYTLSGVGGVTFAPTSGTVTVPKGATTGSSVAVVYFPPLVGNESVTVTSSNGPGLTALTSPTSESFVLDSPFGAAPPPGYWMTTQQGESFSFAAPVHGGLSHPPAPVVGLAEASNGGGYWMVSSKGTVYPFAEPSHGGYVGTPPTPIVGMASDYSNGGYWLFSQGGAIYGYGGAPNYGQGSHLVGPVASGTAAPDGLGYYIVTTNGAVYAFGPGAKWQGNASHPASPVVSMAADLHTGGYWILTAKGVVYAINAPSLGGPTGQAATSITPDPATTGYWVSLANGRVYAFGAGYYGSAYADHPNSALISILGR